MSVDENVFFREATLRICSSLDIETALQSLFEYIRSFIPVIRMDLHILDADLNILRFVAVVGMKPPEGSGQVRLPDNDRDERAAILKNVPIRIMNQPDPKIVSPEFHKSLGLKPNSVSVMNMALKPEGNWIGNLVLVANGLNQYNDEHARLLLLLHGPIAIAMSNAMKHQEVIRLKDMMADDNRYLYSELRSVSGDKIIGSNSGLMAVMEMVNQVASLYSPVLLLGETGTGKEVVANAIHYSSPRKDGPFIKVNCGAIPETLLDSELFGHEKGAFTGAISQRRGRFERANRGTIFLDEIGELPPQAQIRLLHVLQDKEIERVGSTSPIPVDIRIISATHRNLEEMIVSGRFREDLWFRLNVFPIMIPPLRQRREDIPALVYYFIDRKSRELNLRQKPVLASGAMGTLIAYDWPGNVRELENIVERALIQHRGGVLSFDSLMPLTVTRGREFLQNTGQNEPLHSLDEMNARHIRRALELAGGKINGPGGAGQILGVHPNTLRKRMNKLRISYGRKSWQPSDTQRV